MPLSAAWLAARSLAPSSVEGCGPRARVARGGSWVRCRLGRRPDGCSRGCGSRARWRRIPRERRRSLGLCGQPRGPCGSCGLDDLRSHGVRSTQMGGGCWRGDLRAVRLEVASPVTRGRRLRLQAAGPRAVVVRRDILGLRRAPGAFWTGAVLVVVIGWAGVTWALTDPRVPVALTCLAVAACYLGLRGVDDICVKCTPAVSGFVGIIFSKMLNSTKVQGRKARAEIPGGAGGCAGGGRVVALRYVAGGRMQLGPVRG